MAGLNTQKLQIPWSLHKILFNLCHFYASSILRAHITSARHDVGTLTRFIAFFFKCKSGDIMQFGSYPPGSFDTLGRQVPDTSNFLACFDFSAIDSLDPSLAEGHEVIYDREFPMELRMQDSDVGPQEVGTLEPIRCKILLLGDTSQPKHMRVELTSENDLFFHYNHSIDPDIFNRMQQRQKLVIDFADYPNVLMKMFTSCIKEPHSFLAVFVMSRTGESRLDFIQNLEYKFVELLSTEFLESPKDIVRQHVAFRYNALKSKLALTQARLQDINALIKIKNPSLLLHIQKSQNIAGSSGRSTYFYGK